VITEEGAAPVEASGLAAAGSFWPQAVLRPRGQAPLYALVLALLVEVGASAQPYHQDRLMAGHFYRHDEDEGTPIAGR
jgi:hypothetical protein